MKHRGTVDTLIKNADNIEMTKATEEVDLLRKEIDEFTTKISQKDTRISQLQKQITDEKIKYTALQEKLEEHYKDSSEAYKTYEDQLTSMPVEKNTPQ